MSKKNLLFIWVLIVMMLSLNACGPKSEALPPGQTSDQSQSNTASEMKELPEAVGGKDPENFPLIDGSIRLYFMEMGQEEPKDFQVFYAVPVETVGEVFDFYEKELSEYGWEIDLFMHSGDGSILTASMDDGTEVSLVINADSEYEGFNVFLSVTVVH